MFSYYLLVISTIVGFVTLLLRRRRYSNLPGPPGLPFVGNALQMKTTRARRTDEIMTSWAKQYGPIYKVSVFGRELIVVSGCDEVYEVMIKKGRSFAGRNQYYRFNHVVLGSKDIAMGDPTQPQWLILRKTAFRALHQHGIGLNRIEAVLVDAAKDFVKRMTLYNNTAVDLRDDVHNFIAKVGVIMFVGRKPEDDDILLIEIKRLVELIREALSPTSGIELDYFPWLRFFGHPLWKKVQELCAVRDSLWEKLWSESQRTYTSEGEAKCIMHAIAQLLDKNSQFYESTIDIEYAKSLFFDLAGGSVSTTSNVVYALPNILLHYPDVLRKLRDEIDQIIGFDRSPSIFDRDSMPYACATIFELLRYISLLPATDRVTLEETFLGKMLLPVGKSLLCHITALHYDESFWGDPKVFRPERFLDDNGNLLPPENPRRKRLLPFGAGPRVCIGEGFALKRLFIFTTSLIQAFDLEPAEKMVPCDHSSLNDGTMLSPQSYTLKLIPRKSANFSN